MANAPFDLTCRGGLMHHLCSELPVRIGRSTSHCGKPVGLKATSGHYRRFAATLPTTFLFCRFPAACHQNRFLALNAAVVLHRASGEGRVFPGVNPKFTESKEPPLFRRPGAALVQGSELKCCAARTSTLHMEIVHQPMVRHLGCRLMCGSCGPH